MNKLLRIACFAVFSLLALGLSAQTDKLDSLSAEVEKFYLEGDYERAIELVKESLELCKQEEYKDRTAAVKLNLALLYDEVGRFEESISILEALLLEMEKTSGRESTDYISILDNLGRMNSQMGNYKVATSYYQELIKLADKVGIKNGEDYPTYLNNYAVLCQRKEDYKKAIKLYEEVAALELKLFGKNSLDYAITLNNLAYSYEDLGILDKAISYYEQCLDIMKVLDNVPVYYVVAINNNIINLDTKLGNYEKAEEGVLLSLINNSPNLSQNATLDELINQLLEMSYSSKAFALNTLSLYAVMLARRYETKGNQADLEKSYQIYRKTNQLFSHFVNEMNFDADKLELIGQNYKIGLGSIKLAMELDQLGLNKQALEEALNLADQNKSMLLINALKAEGEAVFGDLPKELLEEKQKLTNALEGLDAKLLENKSDPEALQAEKLEKQKELNRLVEKLKAKYPEYYNFQYQDGKIELEALQEKLEEDQLIIEFLTEDTLVYSFVISKKELKVYEHLIDGGINPIISKIHQVLSDYTFLQENPEESFKIFTEEAYKLYQFLLEKTLKENSGYKHLTIIPDGNLGYIPFEVLLTKASTVESGNWLDLDYMLKDYVINYNYSLNLFEENFDYQSTNNGEMLGVASSYTDSLVVENVTRSAEISRLRKILQDLPAARAEVEKLSTKFQGDFWLNQDANEQAFKEKAGDYAIIHLAMHGLLNVDYPILSSMAFTENGDSLEDNFLQAHEISKLKLHADLVVLSACETGYGKFEQGEGVMSLARSFMYAGVPSLVVSLWQVNDMSTSIIMEEFYNELASGKDKPTALRQAKLSYLKKSDDIAAHPAFWAAFVQIGNTNAVALKTVQGSNWIYWLGAVGFGFFFVLILFWIRRRAEAKS
jgi:CHAT domain-containing protein/tetratricopeptide (TPR) repeat protein